MGHTCGVRVDGPLARGLWPPVGGGLCRRVVKGKVLRIDRPDGRRVLKFDGLSGRGLWYRPAGDEYKVSVTDSPFCVIWHDKHSAVISHLRWLFPPLVPYGTTFPPRSGGTIKL